MSEANRLKSHRAKSYAETEKYHIMKCYHDEVAACQSHIGRVLTKEERKKAFNAEQRTSGRADLRGMFHK